VSPVTDLAVAGWEIRAAADPYFTSPRALELVRSYLGDGDPAESRY
jgi:hypothetical protein